MKFKISGTTSYGVWRNLTYQYRSNGYWYHLGWAKTWRGAWQHMRSRWPK